MPETKYIARRAGLFASLMQATELAGFRLESLAPVSLRDVYFDTPAGDLLRQGYSLRVREQGRTAMAQLRTLRAPDSARAREADAILEPPVWGDTLPDLPEGPLREMLEILAGDAPLNAMLRLRQFRTPRVAYDGNRLVGVVSLDVVGYELPARLHVANEIEIELAGTGRESDLYRLDPVLRASGVEPTVRSKFERGVLRLQRGAEDPILLLPSERAALERMLEAPDPALRRRARVVLLAARGLKEETVSARAGLSPSRVKHWVQRFREGRVTGLRTGEAESLPQATPPGIATSGTPSFRVSEIVSRGIVTSPVFRAEHFEGGGDPGFNLERSREERSEAPFELRGDGAGGDGAAGPPPRDPGAPRLHGFDADAPAPLTVIPVEPVEPERAELEEPPELAEYAEESMPEAPAATDVPVPADGDEEEGGVPPPSFEPDIMPASDAAGETETPPLEALPEPLVTAADRPARGTSGPRPLPARPRLGADTPILQAAAEVLGYHYACLTSACDDIAADTGAPAARRALLAAHRVRLSLETFEEFLPDRVVARLHERLRGVARALDVLVDVDTALDRLARATLAGEGAAEESLEKTHHALSIKRDKAHRRVHTRLRATRHVQWTRRMERLLTMLAARAESGRLDAGFFRELPDDYVARRRRPRRVRVRHMLGSTVWRRYEDIRAYEALVTRQPDDERLRPLGAACAALAFVVGLAAHAAPEPARQAASVVGELEALIAEHHRASSTARLVRPDDASSDVRAEAQDQVENALARLPAAWSAVDSESFRKHLADVVMAI